MLGLVEVASLEGDEQEDLVIASGVGALFICGHWKVERMSRGRWIPMKRKLWEGGGCWDKY